MTLAVLNIANFFDRLSFPLTQAALLLCVASVCLFLRRYRTAAAWAAAAALWAWISCTPAFAAWLQRGLVNQNPPKVASSYPNTDAIVVLGGGAVPDSEIDWSYDGNRFQATRLGFGLELYRNRRAPIILLSGGKGEAKRMAEALRQQGVPANALRTEGASTNTHDNALYSAIILKREKRLGILLVTSVLHMPRAAAVFRQQGLTVIASPALGNGLQPVRMRENWRPQTSAMNLSKRCLREYFGLWYYELRGWA